MISTLNSRLAQLEARQVPPVAIATSFTPALRLLCLLLAVHLGDLRPGEDVAAGEARALGYGSAVEMRAAMTAERTAFIGWGSAHNAAVTRMLERHGGGFTAGIEANWAALAVLFAALTKAHATRPEAKAAALAIAAEWVSL